MAASRRSGQETGAQLQTRTSTQHRSWWSSRRRFVQNGRRTQGRFILFLFSQYLEIQIYADLFLLHHFLSFASIKTSSKSGASSMTQSSRKSFDGNVALFISFLAIK